MIDFEGQVVIVTGAGRGLGRLFAFELAQRGASVVVNDLGGTTHGHGSDPSVADQVVAEIESAGGVALASHDSVASQNGGEAIVRGAVNQFGRLDAVVSNAGIFDSVAFDELKADDWRRMLSVHLDGGFYLSQPTADDIGAHLAEISATLPFTVPTSIIDEVVEIFNRLGILGAEPSY